MNNLLSFENQEVEVLEVNGTIYFNPYHIANILDIKNVRDNLRTMNENQVIKLTNSGVGNTDIRKLNNAGELFLTESGVYKLIFKSRKPNAEKFADWVTDEVLPAIRKTGKYETTPTLTRKTYMGKTVMTIKDMEQLSGLNNVIINQYVHFVGTDYSLLTKQKAKTFRLENKIPVQNITNIIVFGLDTATKVAHAINLPKKKLKAVYDYFKDPVQLTLNLPPEKVVDSPEIEQAIKILAVMPDSKFKDNVCQTLLYDILGQDFIQKVDFLSTIQNMAKHFDGLTADEISAITQKDETTVFLNSLSDRGKFLFQRQLNHSISR